MTFNTLKLKVIEFNPEHADDIENIKSTTELIQYLSEVKKITPEQALDLLIACI